jgi:hypothetical protein
MAFSSKPEMGAEAKSGLFLKALESCNIVIGLHPVPKTPS